MSRAKGNRFERAVSPEIIRVDGVDPLISKLASSTGRVGHLDLGADIISRRLAVECKHRQSISRQFWTWLEHVDVPGKAPMLAVKRDRELTLAVLYFDTLLELLSDE